MHSRRSESKTPPNEVPTRVGDALITIKRHVDAVRTVRAGLMDLAYAVTQAPGTSGYLVLVDSTLTEPRVQAEWERAQAMLKREVLQRVTICFARSGQVRGVPHDPAPATQTVIEGLISAARSAARLQSTRVDYSFVILKLLIHQWLIVREPVTMEWIGRAAGCSHPTVARVIKDLGSLIERASDRRVSLRYFPQDGFDRLVANGEAARTTRRFVDRSGQPRSPEKLLRKLAKVRAKGMAIGGVFGARHYLPELDLVGAPRLDISLHSDDGAVDLKFVEELDPALKLEDDPQQPASVVVHAIRHADPLFRPRSGGLHWADPVECLLDLREAKLEMQAAQFLEALKARRVTV